MKFLLKPIFATLVLSLMLVPSTMRAFWWGQYEHAFMPNSIITVQVIGTISASQSFRYLESKTATYIDSFNPPTADMADQTMKIEIKEKATINIELTHHMHYIDFNSMERPGGYVYKRYDLSMITPNSKNIPIISVCHDMYGRPQISYNNEILTPAPMDKHGKLIFRWVQ